MDGAPVGGPGFLLALGAVLMDGAGGWLGLLLAIGAVLMDGSGGQTVSGREEVVDVTSTVGV